MPEQTDEQKAVQIALGQERIRRAFTSAISSMQKLNQSEEDINLLIGIYKDIMKPAEPKAEDDSEVKDE